MLRQYRLIGILPSLAVEELLSFRGQQGIAELFILCEHSLICTSDQLDKSLTLSICLLTFPPHCLVPLLI